MCGIAGFQGQQSPELLPRMSACVSHRGPDGEGHVLLPSGGGTRTGLAHRRLSIVDLSDAAAQPMTVHCDRCGAHNLRDLALTYNGELYNFPALRAELEAKGHAFHSRADSEVLLHLYAEEGPAMLSRLNGIFAFAIHDGRQRGQQDGMRTGDLLLVRDPMGVKPLYVAATAEGTLFASEIKALLADPGVARELDHEALHYTLAYLWTPASQTLLTSVRRLLPGEALILRGGTEARRWRYYDLPVSGPPLEDGNFDASARALREGIDAAVDRQMMSDVPVGAFLSGGLDSSAVVAAMKRTHPDSDPQCYCIGFAGDESIEGNPADMPYARRVAAHLGVTLHEVVVDPSIARHLERMLWALDEPQADPAPINALLIAEQARRDSIPVLLSGTGGDDLFSGYRRHRALGLERFWSWLPAPARRGVAAMARSRTGGSAWARRASKAFAHADLSGDERLVRYFWWSGEQMRRALYAPAMSERMRHVDTAGPLLATLQEIPRVQNPLDRMLYLEAKHFLADHNLNYTDKTGMAAGIEVRVPLLDLELVALAARIPAHHKQRGMEGKAVLRRAMSGILPDEVIHRRKSGFGVPLRRWLRGEMRDLVEETLSEHALRQRGLFDASAVRGLIDLDRAGRIDGSYTVFALVCLELWCRMFIDGKVPSRA